MSEAVPPVGMVDLGYVQITNLTFAVGLTPPQGTVLAIISPEDGNVRWRADGPNPTGDVGTPLWGTSFLEWAGNLTAIKFINMTGSVSTLNVTYFGVAEGDDDIFIIANNAISTLDVAVLDNTTLMELRPGTGNLFPAPGAGQYTMCTLSGGGLWEIVRVNSRVVDELTVVRGQEGTIALPWPRGTLIQNLLTAGEIFQLLQKPELTAVLILTRLGKTAGPDGTVLTSNGPNQSPGWEYPSVSQSVPPPGMVDLGYIQVTDLNAAQGLSAPAGTLQVVISPQDGNVRWRADGTNPTGDVGNIIWGTSDLPWGGDMNAFRMINMTDSAATVNLQFYGVAS